MPVTDSGWAQIGGIIHRDHDETGLTLYAQLVGATTRPVVLSGRRGDHADGAAAGRNTGCDVHLVAMAVWTAGLRLDRRR